MVVFPRCFTSWVFAGQMFGRGNILPEPSNSFGALYIPS